MARDSLLLRDVRCENDTNSHAIIHFRCEWYQRGCLSPSFFLSVCLSVWLAGCLAVCLCFCVSVSVSFGFGAAGLELLSEHADERVDDASASL